MANAIAGVCETEFTALTSWFGITTGFGTSDRITVTVQSISAGGANNFGYSSRGGSVINVNFLPAGFSDANAAEIAKMMFVNEIVEIFMDFNNKESGTTTWVAGHSDGEGLSQFCGILRFPVGHRLAYNSWANAWLSSTRDDFVTSNKSTDGDSVSFGCALLFLFYLNTQLQFTPAQIIQNGTATLAGCYTNLTGDGSNPFGFFKSLLDATFPGTATIPDGTAQRINDPYPLFSLRFWDDKNSFGRSEVVDHVAHGRAFSDAFLLVLEGFSPTAWQALGSAAPSDPTLGGGGFPDIHFNRTHVQFENAALPKAPQRINFHYDINFGANSTSGFSGSVQTKELASSITISGAPQAAVTELIFYGAQDPYFANIDPRADNVPWLSDDLRVFAATPGGVPVPGGPSFSTDSLDGARSYLAALLPWLTAHYGDPTLTDPFDPAANVVPMQAGALTGDSSVLPNLHFLGINQNFYNFAIARVRLDGPSGTVADPVKVFFRMWQSQSPDTDYDPSATYARHTDAVGQPDWPLPAPDGSTFPFFASGNTPNFSDTNNLELGTHGVNRQKVTIAQAGGQWAYFGCLLNVYDSSYLVNGTPVTNLLSGTHHCIVAQIAYDDAPIVVPSGQTVSPGGGTDKLAQRNLQITAAFNPGRPPTNRVPQTFDVRPSRPSLSRLSPPDFDELMVDWGNVPTGAVAHIYWPGSSADQVIRLADQRYGYHDLRVVDPHTIAVPVIRGVSYVPIPPGAGERLAGLLSVDLPPGVRKGQRFTMVVKRVTTRRGDAPPPPPSINTPPADAVTSPAITVDPKTVGETQRTVRERIVKPQPSRDWRYVTGAFQVDIPVQADEDLLPFDENTLAIFKWRVQVTPTNNRWRPVLERYVQILSERIRGLGGDPAVIEPSPMGLPGPVSQGGKALGGEEEERFCGRVTKVIYDCGGEFKGFELEWCEGERHFESRERGVETLVLRCLGTRDRLEVIVDHGRIRGLIVQP